MERARVSAPKSVTTGEISLFSINTKIGILFRPWQHPIDFWRESKRTERARVPAPKSVTTTQEVPSALLIWHHRHRAWQGNTRHQGPLLPWAWQDDESGGEEWSCKICSPSFQQRLTNDRPLINWTSFIFPFLSVLWTMHIISSQQTNHQMTMMMALDSNLPLSQSEHHGSSW